MLAVVVSLGVLIVTFASGSLKSFSGNYVIALTNQKSASAEKFAVEQVAFSFSGTTGADLYVRNVGTFSSTLVAVYITDATSSTFVSETTISTTVSVGNFVEIPHATLTFTPAHGHTYSFTVTSSLGNSVIYSAEAA